MKIRIAKKIMMYNDNAKINQHQQKRFRELRPPFLNEHGFMVYPSYHDIDLIRRARTRLLKWINNNHSANVSKMV